MKVDIIAVMLLVAACILFAIEAQPSKDYTLSDIRKYQSDRTLLISISIILLVTTGLQLIVGMLRKHILTEESNGKFNAIFRYTTFFATYSPYISYFVTQLKKE